MSLVYYYIVMLFDSAIINVYAMTNNDLKFKSTRPPLFALRSYKEPEIMKIRTIYTRTWFRYLIALFFRDFARSIAFGFLLPCSVCVMSVPKERYWS